MVKHTVMSIVERDCTIHIRFNEYCNIEAFIKDSMSTNSVDHECF
jgi:hypothetical protein